jgi:hypothetical protein
LPEWSELDKLACNDDGRLINMASASDLSLFALQLEMYKEALKALKEEGMGYGTKAGAFSRM